MFALPGLLALLLVDYLRPQVHVPALQSLRLLHLSVALAAAGLVLDLRLGLSRLRAAPHLALTLLFFGWSLVTVAANAPGAVVTRAAALLIPLSVYLLTAHTIQTFRSLEVLCGVLLAISLVLSGIGIHQGFAPKACHRVVPVNGEATWVSDGRPCEEYRECEPEGDPGVEYACERAGLLGTSTITGRVRWMGTMEDPNELSLALGVALPFAFAFVDRRRSAARLLALVVAAVMAGVCAILTQSRGGQLVFLTVLGSYFVRQIGALRGGLIGLALALPLVLLGGRSDGGADESTQERTFLWWLGLHFFTRSPGFGVGSGRFLEHYHQTAHNSWVLSLAELGFPGLLLLSSVIWVSFKIIVAVLRAPDAAPVARTWATALMASLTGMMVGITFLSFIYKNALWLFVGLTGVLYQAVKRHDPGFEVRFGVRDLGFVALADLGLIVGHVGYTGAKLGW